VRPLWRLSAAVAELSFGAWLRPEEVDPLVDPPLRGCALRVDADPLLDREDELAVPDWVTPASPRVDAARDPSLAPAVAGASSTASASAPHPPSSRAAKPSSRFNMALLLLARQGCRASRARVPGCSDA
jgi:hypothetical protein